MKVKIFPPRGCDRSVLDERSWADLPEGSTVGDVLKLIKCSPLKAKLLLVSVNGEHSKLDHVLKEGDVIGFFTLVSGG
ncbi:MAG: MoaD/ThiS family protein [Mogibacterium sp.]|nr:MoaD/ThiS family protein [Mogibacterium sp.]